MTYRRYFKRFRPAARARFSNGVRKSPVAAAVRPSMNLATPRPSPLPIPPGRRPSRGPRPGGQGPSKVPGVPGPAFTSAKLERRGGKPVLVLRGVNLEQVRPSTYPDVLMISFDSSDWIFGREFVGVGEIVSQTSHSIVLAPIDQTTQRETDLVHRAYAAATKINSLESGRTNEPYPTIRGVPHMRFGPMPLPISSHMRLR